MAMHKLGNAIVGQSGGPTAAINATLAGVIRGALKAKEEGKLGTLYGMYHGIEGALADDLIDLLVLFDHEKILKDLELTPAAALGSCRKKLPQDPKDPLYDTLFENFAKNDIRYFFYIGGNDSMDTVAKLSRAATQRDYPIIINGVPKTIDNDLAGMDHTPGFGSAAKYIAVTMSEIIADCSVYQIPAVTIVEIMGRDAGWLTASAGLPWLVSGAGPDYIYLPERAFSLDAFLEDVKGALAKHPNVVIAVSEGIRDAAGEYVGAMGQTGAVDAFGHKYLAGTAKVLTQFVKDQLDCKVRAIELNLPQRCASHLASATDLAESSCVGEHAFEMAMEGLTGCVATIERIAGDEYAVTYGHHPVSEVANLIKTVPEAFINEEGNGVTDECLSYLLPLIQGERKGRYVNGLPYHIRLK